MRHYVYYSYEEYGRGYIGVRSSEKDPARDPYMGSYKDKSFSPTHKIVLEEYSTREEAARAEITLHAYYDIGRNQHFANKAKATALGFGCGAWNKGKTGIYSEESLERMRKSSTGKIISEETREKIRQAHLGRECVWSDKIAKATLGKKKTMTEKALEARKRAGKTRRGSTWTMSEEGKENIRKAAQNREKAPNKGMKCWNNGVRNTYSIECPGDGWVRGARTRKPTRRH